MTRPRKIVAWVGSSGDVSSTPTTPHVSVSARAQPASFAAAVSAPRTVTLAAASQRATFAGTVTHPSAAAQVQLAGQAQRATFAAQVNNFPYVSITLSEVIPFGSLNKGYAQEDTNAIIHSRCIATNLNNGDVAVAFYRNPDGQVVLAYQPGGVGPFQEIVATSAIVGASDDHRSMKIIWDDQDKLLVWLGTHSEQERYCRLDVSDLVITDAKIAAGSPRVPGGGAIEASATYHDPKRLPDGTIALTWRAGGSGNGDQVLDTITAGVWTRRNAKVIDGEGVRSPYCNDFICFQSNSPHPNRLVWTYQFRDGINEIDAHGLYGVYSDDLGVTLKGIMTGATLTAHVKLADLGAAGTIEDIPPARTDPAYSYYFGLQGACGGDDGGVNVVAVLTPTAANIGTNYGTPTGPSVHYAWRVVPGSNVVKKIALKTFPFDGTVTGGSRPACIWRGNRLYCFYTAQYTSDAVGTGKLYCATADGPTLLNVQEQELFMRNGVNDLRSASFVYDATAWQGGAGTLKQFWFKSSVNGASPTTAASNPALSTIAFAAVRPVLMTFSEVLGVLRWEVDGDLYSADGSGNIQSATDVSGHVSFAQATPANRPVPVPADLNGHTTWQMTGATWLTAAQTVAAPGTTPRFFGLLVRQDSPGWVSGNRLLDANGALLFQTGASPNLRMNHAVSSNTESHATVNAWHFLQVQFNNATTDYFKTGITGLVTGSNSGNVVTSTALTLGAAGGGVLPAKFKLACAFEFGGARPTSAQLYQLQGILLAKYGLTAVG